MRTIPQNIPHDLVALIEKLRSWLCSAEFKARHRVRAQDFTRQRQLTFTVVMLFTLQKTVKSIQRHLHEFLDELAGGQLYEPVTSGAWTHARAKLKHTAFEELNRECVLPWIYGPQASRPMRLWHGHRLLGVDSSLVRLPNHRQLFEQFSPVEVSNQSGQTGIRYPEARMSVLYDLNNRVALDGRLEPSSLGEVELAIEQLKQAKAGDVLINDRGYTGYEYLAWHHHLGLHLIARCSRACFRAAQDLFRLNRAGRSLQVKLFAPAHVKVQLRQLGLPLELVVRFVSLRLPTGELEVLVTSLLDPVEYPTQEFLEVYHRRWNHETFYGMVKGRLDLENFTGETAEAVRQDFHSTLLVANLESVLSAPAEDALKEQSAGHLHPKQVNRAVCYHALKDQLLELLASQTPAETVLAKLQKLFLNAAVSVRAKRKVPRPKSSLSRGYHFQKRVKKFVF
ncbi:MAG: IS4 family transposase [Nitrospira sp.]|nr:IS4 family transposase [Nitrospira sp.]